MVELIESMGWYARTTFISFCGTNLEAIREKYADADIQFLSCACGEEEIAYMEKFGFDADLHSEIISKELVDTLHAKGKKVNCWTVNDLATAEYLRDCGVDFITTNILE